MKTFNQFLVQSISEGYLNKFIPKELAWITLKYLVTYSSTPIYRIFYLSRNDREYISKAWGNRLPNGFASPETSYHIGYLLTSAIYDNLANFSEVPYFDDSDLVFPYDSKTYEFRVNNNQIKSTWEELVEWMKKNLNLDPLLIKWLETDLSWNEFKQAHRGIFTGKKFGI